MAALGTQHFLVSDEEESKSRLAESGSAWKVRQCLTLWKQEKDFLMTRFGECDL